MALHFLSFHVLWTTLFADPPATLERSAASDPNGSLVRLSLAPGVGLVDAPFPSLSPASLGLGANATLMFRFSDSVYFGLESGLYRWLDASEGETLTGQSTKSFSARTSIPILATALYRFRGSHHRSHPYLGLSAGVSLTQGYSEYKLDGTSTTIEEERRVQFEALLRTGVEIDWSRAISFFFEGKVGFLSRHFFVFPHAGLLFSF